MQEWPEGYRLMKSKKFVQTTSRIDELLKQSGASETAIHLIKQMLKYDGASRITAAQASQHEFFKIAQFNARSPEE